MQLRQRLPVIFIVVMVFFVVLFSTVAYVAYQRKRSGVLPLDISQIQKIRKLVK